MKGKIIPLDFRTTEDSETGHRVIRMTPPHVICHRNYFYQNALPGMAANLFSAADSRATGTTIYSILPRNRPFN